MIGNMNNNFFSWMRYLRDYDIDAHLFLTDAEQSHFLPECDTHDNKYSEYIHQLNWGHPISYFFVSSKKIKTDLKGFDFNISCGFAPAFLKKSNIPINLFKPYGGDIWGRPIFESLSPKRMIINAGIRWIQKKGVPYADIIQMPNTNDLYENRLNKLNKKHIRWNGYLPMIYHPEYDINNLDTLLELSKYGKELKSIRNENDVLILSHNRHFWYNKKSDDPDNKGTDKLIKGYANFVKSKKNIKSQLIFLEYGIDVEFSKKLIKDLDIEDKVTWLPKMYRKDIMVCLLLCDIVCGQFTNSWNSSGVLFEALVGGKPILSYRNISEKTEESLYDIMNANTIEDIENHFNNFIKTPNNYKKMGLDGLEWYKSEVVQKTMEKLVQYLIDFEKRKIDATK